MNTLVLFLEIFFLVVTCFANHVSLPISKYSTHVKKEPMRLEFLFEQLSCKRKNKS